MKQSTHHSSHSFTSAGARRAGLALAAAALLAAGSAAHAGDVAVGVSVGAPVLGNAVYTSGTPVATVSVGYRGGYRGGYGGGYGGGYYRGGGGFGWGVGIGLGTGLLLAAPWYYPGVVVAQPPTTVIVEQPAQGAAAPAAAAAQTTRPEPVIYPRNGQSAQQLEADRQECNRWATTQPAALTDSSVFMRAIDACMDGRGYTTK